MADVLWIIGALAIGGIGFWFGVWCNKQTVEADMWEMRNDVFDICYDYGIHPHKKTPLVFRIKNLDKYFDLNEVRMDRPGTEPVDNYELDNISSRVTADGTVGMVRGTKTIQDGIHYPYIKVERNRPRKNK